MFGTAQPCHYSTRNQGERKYGRKTVASLCGCLLVRYSSLGPQSFGWTIQMILPFGALAQAVGLAAAATLIAGYFPARWAARQPVVEGLREE